MGIQNFPAALQPMIQQNFLAREFEQGLRSVTAFRAIADREDVPQGIGETVTKTKPGLKAPVTTPLNAAGNTNFDNGLTPSTWTLEQYTLGIDMYGDSIDLNMVTTRVGIASQFLQNALTNGIQASQSLDRIARNSLFNAYLGGNTRVKTTLGAPAATIAVDDVRGFENVMVNGKMVSVSPTNTMSVVVGASSYTLTGATRDGSNTSTAALAGGVSGTLTFSGNVTVADGTAGKAVVSAVAPKILRPSARASTNDLVAADLFTMGLVLDAVAYLRSNGVPTVGGRYNCYLDPTSARQLFADPDFKLLFQGATNANEVFRMGIVVEIADVRFIPTTEAYVHAHPSVAGLQIRRPIVCGQRTLVEGDFDGMAESDIAPEDALIDVIDGIVQVTREPMDRLKQIIAQSWYWIGGFTAPTDQTLNTAIMPTASPSYYKRAVVIEHVG